MTTDRPRRSFITGILVMGAAPAIVRADALMRVRPPPVVQIQRTWVPDHHPGFDSAPIHNMSDGGVIMFIHRNWYDYILAETGMAALPAAMLLASELAPIQGMAIRKTTTRS